MNCLDQFSRYKYRLPPALQYLFLDKFLFVIGPTTDKTHNTQHKLLVVLPTFGKNKQFDCREVQSIDIPKGEVIGGIVDRSANRHMRRKKAVDMNKDGFLVYTDLGVYLCHKIVDENDLLLDLCSDSSIPPGVVQDLSKTLEADSYNLYEIAADRALAGGKYEEAFRMYKYSSA
eukprot:UN29114